MHRQPCLLRLMDGDESRNTGKAASSIRHIYLPGKGLLGEEQGALHMWMSLAGIYPFASALPLRLSLLPALQAGWDVPWC